MSELGRNSPEENLRASKRKIVVVLDNIRSGNNVGSILRTADAMGVKEVILCGITPQPPDRQVIKSAIGAENSVKWSYSEETSAVLIRLKDSHAILLVEQTLQSTDLGSENMKANQKPVVIVLGNELNGINDELLPLADMCVQIPQFGAKHSLNVAVCAGMVLWELCRESAT